MKLRSVSFRQRERLVCWFLGNSLATVGGSVVEGEDHDVTPAVVADGDGGPSASVFMWNHFPSKGSLPTH